MKTGHFVHLSRTSDGDFNNTTKLTNFTEMEHKSMDMSEKQRFYRS